MDNTDEEGRPIDGLRRCAFEIYKRSELEEIINQQREFLTNKKYTDHMSDLNTIIKQLEKTLREHHWKEGDSGENKEDIKNEEEEKEENPIKEQKDEKEDIKDEENKEEKKEENKEENKRKG